MTPPRNGKSKIEHYAKGELFEQKVFDYLSGELAAGRLLLTPEFSTIYRKKKYFSRYRESFNAFAAYLLMPKQAFLERLARLAVIHNIRNRGHGFLYLDTQPVNYQLVQYVSDDLSKHFNVSRAAVRLRLMSLGLLVDPTSTSGLAPSTSQIVSRRRG